MKIKDNFDIIYIIIAGMVILLDIFTRSIVFESLAFILIVMGFVFAVIPNKKNLKDERISYIKLFSGYIGFMITTIVIWLLSLAYRYASFSLNTDDLLRYIILCMYFTFISVYAISKRKM